MDDIRAWRPKRKIRQAKLEIPYLHRRWLPRLESYPARNRPRLFHNVSACGTSRGAAGAFRILEARNVSTEKNHGVKRPSLPRAPVFTAVSLWTSTAPLACSISTGCATNYDQPPPLGQRGCEIRVRFLRKWQLLIATTYAYRLARISRADNQDTAAQVKSLGAANCKPTFEEHGPSGYIAVEVRRG